MKKILFLVLSCLTGGLSAQFAPAAPHPDSEAILKDDARILSWATSAHSVRGFINIQDTTRTFTFQDKTSNRATFGADSLVLGKKFGPGDLLCLGDSGYVTLGFEKAIANGAGPDFAVFENGFKLGSDTSYYLELAFVEVSSDGLNFFRFPSISLTQTENQISDADGLNPSKLHNLAGKLPFRQGVAFDLDEIQDDPKLDKNNVQFVRVVDAIGAINNKSSVDAEGNVVNDPFPTPYHTGGFDLMAVAVLNQKSEERIFALAGNPLTSSDNIRIFGPEIKEGAILNLSGDVLLAFSGNSIHSQTLKPGIYLLRCKAENNSETLKLLIR